MTTAKLRSLEKKIAQLKMNISKAGDMRPGSLTAHSRKAKVEYGEYWQLSYTHKGKGGTKYVPTEFVDKLKQEIEEYKRFKLLYENLISAAIEYSDLRLNLAKEEVFCLGEMIMSKPRDFVNLGRTIFCSVEAISFNRFFPFDSSGSE
jgi:hypothetical protein